MSKVSLQVNEKDVFGEFMPSVNIDRVEVSYSPRGDDDTWEYGDRTRVTMYMSVYITYPPHLYESGEAAKRYINDNLGDIRLFYVWNPYSGFNKNLRRNRLMLQDLFIGGYRELVRGDSYASLDFLSRYEGARVHPADRLPTGTDEYSAVHASTELVSTS